MQKAISTLRPTVILFPTIPPPPPAHSGSAEELRDVIKKMQEAQEDPHRLLAVKLFDNSFMDDFLRMIPSGASSTLRPLCKILVSDVETLSQTVKLHFNRPRPAEVARAEGFFLDNFNSDTDSSPAYPSGHAFGSRILALALSDVFPHRRSVLFQLSKIVGQSRIDGGLHFPSDVEAGYRWAENTWKATRGRGFNPRDSLSLDEGKLKDESVF